MSANIDKSMTLADHDEARTLWNALRAEVKDLSMMNLMAVHQAYKKGKDYSELPGAVQTALGTITKKLRR